MFNYTQAYQQIRLNRLQQELFYFYLPIASILLGQFERLCPVQNVVVPDHQEHVILYPARETFTGKSWWFWSYELWNWYSSKSKINTAKWRDWLLGLKMYVK